MVALFVVQLLSHVWLFVNPWTIAYQAFLSFTISWSLLRLMSIELIMPSHLILSCPLLLPSIFLTLLYLHILYSYISNLRYADDSILMAYLLSITLIYFYINNLRYADNTTLMAESETKEPLDEDERGEWKSWFKTQHSKN